MLGQRNSRRTLILTPRSSLPTLSSQLTLAPRFLPSTLVSVDFAANYLTKIYGLTFGQKPNLRSKGSWAQLGEWGGAIRGGPQGGRSRGHLAGKACCGVSGQKLQLKVP